MYSMLSCKSVYQDNLANFNYYIPQRGTKNK